MKITILTFLTFIQIGSSCYNVFRNGSGYDYGYYRRRGMIINNTITCSSIYKINEIFYTYRDDYLYDQFLKITDSNITTLHPNELSQFSTIVKLYLSGIHIKEILPGAFTGLLKLKELYLDNNQLSEISKGVFTSLQKLEILDLSHNQIHKMEKFALMGVSSLRKLHLQSNNLSKIEDDAFDKLTGLTYLDLSGNPVDKVKIDDLTNLDDLLLHKTRFKEFSLSNANLTLDLLNLTWSQITTVDFSKFPKVETLDLSNNNISLVENCQSLESVAVSLAHNRIRFVKTGFKKVSILLLAYNQLESVNQTLLNNSESVLIVDLSFNKISAIEKDSLKNLLLLDRLNLGSNNISSLNPGLFDNLISLRTLILSFNNIEVIKYGIFNNLKSLELLDLSHNKITELHPFNFYSMSKLVYLSFDYNKVSSFDVKDLTSHLPSILTISLEGNIWKCKDLIQMNHELKNMSVFIAGGDSFYVENFKGIACQNDHNIKNEETEKVLFQDFETLMNDSVRNSEFHRFLNEDFKNSEFVKFFATFNGSGPSTGVKESSEEPDSMALNAIDVKNEGGNAILVLSLVLQVVMCFLLVLIAYILFGLLKKLNPKTKDQSYSQVELCSNEL